jgi:hypothetical protein
VAAPSLTVRRPTSITVAFIAPQEAGQAGARGGRRDTTGPEGGRTGTASPGSAASTH